MGPGSGNPPDTRQQAEPVIQAAHGGLILLLLLLPIAIPTLKIWPFYLLIPLLLYATVVLLFPPLRQSVHWARCGRLRPHSVLTTAAVAAASCGALILFNRLAQPDLESLRTQLPDGGLAPIWFLGGIFSLTNAIMEEVLFRGILLDAMTAQVGLRLALVFQALAFGLIHRTGYPPGNLGMALAAIFGLILGLLRIQTGGMAAPILVHIAADATIFWIIVS